MPFLQSPSSGHFVHRFFHGAGDSVGVKNDLSAQIPRRTAGYLHKGGMASEESFIVRVKYGYQRNFRNIQPLAQKIYSYQRVKSAPAQIT